MSGIRAVKGLINFSIVSFFGAPRSKKLIVETMLNRLELINLYSGVDNLRCWFLFLQQTPAT